MHKEFSFGNKKIGVGHPTFIIAEAGVNHNGDIELAKQLVTAAKLVGADCVKFQTFTAEHLVTQGAPKAAYQLQVTDPGESQETMLRNLQLKPEEYTELMAACAKAGILFMSTPYNFVDVDFLESLGVQAYKLASMQLTELPMVEYVAKKGKPIIMATGMTVLSDSIAAAETCAKAGNEDIVILQCTTNYPSHIEDANLLTIRTIADATGALVGFSDHTTGIEAPVLSVAAGACVIERHFTLDKNLPGPDHSSSSDPKEFAEMVRRVREAEVILGSAEKKITAREALNVKGMKRSLASMGAIPAGTVITAEMIDFKRPMTGLAPNRYHEVLGKKTRRDIPSNTTIVDEDVVW